MGPMSQCPVASFQASAGSGISRPRYSACGTVASTNFWRSSSFVKRLIFQRMACSECTLSLSEGPNIITDGHHQRFSASCAMAFCSGVPRASDIMIS